MRQEIYNDRFSIHDWDTEHGSRCFIHLVNSATWQAITGHRQQFFLPPRQTVKQLRLVKNCFEDFVLVPVRKDFQRFSCQCFSISRWPVRLALALRKERRRLRVRAIGLLSHQRTAHQKPFVLVTAMSVNALAHIRFR